MYFGRATGRLWGQVWKLSYPNFAKWPAEVYTNQLHKERKLIVFRNKVPVKKKSPNGDKNLLQT